MPLPTHCVRCKQKFDRCVPKKFEADWRRDDDWENLCVECAWKLASDSLSENPHTSEWFYQLQPRKKKVPDSGRGLADAGVYVIRGRGKLRYVGETVSLLQRRPDEIALRAVRLLKPMPGSFKRERLLEEAKISKAYKRKGYTIVNQYRGQNEL